MQIALELLAPAQNKDIGIAAIGCGADALYIGGPQFGARQAAGNSVSDIAALAKYAHIYGAKVYTTINTILYDSELEAARKLMWDLYEAGVDAFIVQDLGLLQMDRPPLPLFASTQTFITTPQKAQFLESLGFQRLIIERQLSLEQVRAICGAVKCDVEFFVHGALCMSYSGQCYLSQRLAGRSANRGECGQPCRSKYDLVDGSGKVLLRDKHLLSLKDYRLDGRIGDLVEAGITSFKIEGRLKNGSYVKNVVRHYRAAIDSLLLENPQYSKSSYGGLHGGFAPNPDLTFGRGYTTAFVDRVRGKWMSDDSAKSMGEYIGEISSKSGGSIVVKTRKTLFNGDGLAFSSGGSVVGARADLCEMVNGGVRVALKESTRLKIGDNVYRNFNIKFEKELENNLPKRLMKVEVDYTSFGGDSIFVAKCENGKTAEFRVGESYPVAQKEDLALSNLRQQFGKITEPFIFAFGKADCDKFYFYPASFLNMVRRGLATQLLVGDDDCFAGARNDRYAACNGDRAVVCGHDSVPCNDRDIACNGNEVPCNDRDIACNDDRVVACNDIGAHSNDREDACNCGEGAYTHLSLRGSEATEAIVPTDYRLNCANTLARKTYTDYGVIGVAPAYEIEPRSGVPLMRSKYCLRYELGLCLKTHKGSEIKSPLYLVNGPNRLRLDFDCEKCEMSVTL